MLAALPLAACGGGEGPGSVSVGEAPDASTPGMDETGMDEPTPKCESVRLDGDFVVEQEADFTARYRVGEPYTKTVMLFGGEAVDDDNVLSNAYIFALDKMDAQMLAERYADFYLCSSPGGQEAASYIIPYDLVPATCQIHEQIVSALRQFRRNSASGGDRTSLRFDGAPLQLESVIEDATGNDVTDQITDQDFHLVTRVEQLSGQSVLSFGTSE